jgi:parallel beta-helix repeat protein
MRHARFASTLSLATLLSAALAACGGEIPAVAPEGGGGSGGAGGGATGGGGAGGGPPADCTVILEPSDDDTTTLQTAFTQAQSNDVICLSAGTYKPQAELSLNVLGVTLKGIGATRDDVVLDFADQLVDDDSMSVTSDGFTIEKLTIKNSPNNGIVVNNAEDVVFRDLKVSWDAGPSSENGAYAVYPVGCTKVLVEDCEVTAAADAGIYVGQSDQIIVRNNKVYQNVAGIEIENSNNAEVYGNETYDNTAGILVFVLPNLEKKDGVACNVHDNDVHDNNHPNFAASGIVGSVPPGIGILVLAADETEIHDNDLHDNNSTAITVVGFETLSLLNPEFMPNDPMTDGFAERTYIYDNTYTNNGTDIAPILLGIGLNPLPDIVFDGCEAMAGSAELCLSMTPHTSFVNATCNVGNPPDYSTDTAPFVCDHPKQAPITL